MLSDGGTSNMVNKSTSNKTGATPERAGGHERSGQGTAGDSSGPPAKEQPVGQPAQAPDGGIVNETSERTGAGRFGSDATDESETDAE